MNKPIKPRRCAVCKEEYIPKRIGLKITKNCGNSACELDYVQMGKNQNTKCKPKSKQRKLSAIKNELWELFSLHQKLVHSEDGKWCNCYTCDKSIQIGTRDCQGGHCMSKSGNPNLFFDERAVRPQCLRCNVPLGGMHYEFNERLKQEIGLESWQDMYDNRKKVNKYNRQWFGEKIEYYKVEVERLKKVKALAITM